MLVVAADFAVGFVAAGVVVVDSHEVVGLVGLVVVGVILVVGAEVELEALIPSKVLAGALVVVVASVVDVADLGTAVGVVVAPAGVVGLADVAVEAVVVAVATVMEEAVGVAAPHDGNSPIHRHSSRPLSYLHPSRSKPSPPRFQPQCSRHRASPRHYGAR